MRFESNPSLKKHAKEEIIKRAFDYSIKRLSERKNGRAHSSPQYCVRPSADADGAGTISTTAPVLAP